MKINQYELALERNLKANMRVVGNAEYGLLLYRDKLPKFRNNGKMVFNVIDWERDDQSSALYEKIHPTQKPIATPFHNRYTRIPYHSTNIPHVFHTIPQAFHNHSTCTPHYSTSIPQEFNTIPQAFHTYSTRMPRHSTSIQLLS